MEQKNKNILTSEEFDEIKDECESSLRMIVFTMIGTSTLLIISAIIVSIAVTILCK